MQFTCELLLFDLVHFFRVGQHGPQPGYLAVARVAVFR
jgi:hypothetical protein